MVFENIPAWEIFVFFFLMFIFFVTGMVILLIVMNRLRWPFIVTILENVSGSGLQPVGRDRAKRIGFGDSGEEIFFLKKRKKYRVGYGHNIGKNKIAFAIGRDGYWYNVKFGDIDKQLLEVGVIPIDRDMRFASASLRKGIETRYNEKTFFEKYGVAITIGMLIIAVLIQAGANWFVLDKQLEVSGALQGAIEASEKVMETTVNVLSKLDNIKSGGSGLVGG